VVACEVHCTYICTTSSDSALNPFLSVSLLTAVAFLIFPFFVPSSAVSTLFFFSIYHIYIFYPQFHSVHK
jgi:hypothetical protein